MREILVSVSICFICWLREKHRDRCLLSGTFASEFVISLSIFLLTRECFIRETKYVIWLGEGTKFGDDINIHKKIYFFRSLKYIAPTENFSRIYSNRTEFKFSAGLRDFLRFHDRRRIYGKIFVGWPLNRKFLESQGFFLFSFFP